jgi:hypothetical protein
MEGMACLQKVAVLCGSPLQAVLDVYLQALIAGASEYCHPLAKWHGFHSLRFDLLGIGWSLPQITILTTFARSYIIAQKQHRSLGQGLCDLELAPATQKVIAAAVLYAPASWLEEPRLGR